MAATTRTSKAPIRTIAHDATCLGCGVVFQNYSRLGETLEPHERATHCQRCNFAAYQHDQALKTSALDRARHIAADVAAGNVTVERALAILRRSWRETPREQVDTRRLIHYTADALKLLGDAADAELTIIDYVTPTAEPVPVPVVPVRLDEVAYTVVYGAGARDYLTVKVRPHWDAAKAAAGEQVLAYHVTGGERPYESAAFIAGGRLTLFGKYRDTELGALVTHCYAILSASAAGMLAARTEYAVRTGTCALCGRPLRVPASLNDGVGPECAKKVSVLRDR